ncbi:MAG: hypothetical protein ACRDD1_03910, partial [Planctomycetia bacterium]
MTPHVPPVLRTSLGGFTDVVHALGVALALDPNLPTADEPTSAWGSAVGALAVTAVSLDIPLRRLVEHLAPLAADSFSTRELTETALARLVRRDVATQWTPRLAGLLSDLDRAYRADPPAVDDATLNQRLEELRRGWLEMGGPWTARVRNATAPDLFVAEARVIGVRPVVGGAGTAHPAYNSCRIELIEENEPASRGRPFPEVGRLLWLVAQLNLDMPQYREALPAGAVEEVGRLALLPAVVAAVDDVDEPSAERVAEAAQA